MFRLKRRVRACNTMVRRITSAARVVRKSFKLIRKSISTRNHLRDWYSWAESRRQSHKRQRMRRLILFVA